MIGKSLRHYQIESHLGTGGMGEVYQARDTRLGRSVAVKVLPDAVAGDPGRIARFEREAKLLASLNHPNIAVLHGMEQAGSKHFLVMELVQGETLAGRLRRGPLPVEEALSIANQMAEALEAAHAKGVVHRDLKPANVKVTPEGKVKVLDFGLAKAMETAPVNSNLSDSPTISMAATNAGVILGTAGYMSPEQAKGASADTRSDIFSFGCVLYEMLSGRQPFHGETVSEVIAAVLVSDPDWNLLPRNLSPRINALVRRCMDKSPRRRWQAAGDVRVEIELLLADPFGLVGTAREPAQPRSLWKSAAPVLLAAILAGVATAMVVLNLRPPVPPALVTRLPLPLPENQRFTVGPFQIIAISPDGTKLVYAANQNQLFLRHMSEVEARPIPGTLGGGIGAPVFSPDSQFVAFFSASDQSIKTIAVSGGAVTLICKAYGVGSASWNGDQIVFADSQRGIMRVSDAGGEPEVLVKTSGPELPYGPQILDDGKAVLYTVTNGTTPEDFDQAQIIVQRLPLGDRKVILRGGSDARYVPSGHIIYAFGGSIRAVPFDLKTLAVTGDATSVIEGVMRSSVALAPATQLSFSSTGALIYVPGQSSIAPERRTLALVDRTGNIQPLPLAPAPYRHPRFSPGGKQLVVETKGSEDQIISVYEISGGASLRRLTIGGRSSSPIWSRDGRYIIFTSDRDGNPGLFRQLADGAGSAERLTTAEPTTVHEAQSIDPAGKTLLFAANGILWTRPYDGDGKPTRFGNAGMAVQIQADFSRDGRWLAYISTKLGTPQIFVQPYPSTPGVEYQVTTEGAGFPLWSHDGNQLFYVTDPVNPKINVVDIRTVPTFSFKNPVVLPITGTLHPIPGMRNYDLSPDGKQFIVVMPDSQAETNPAARPQINIVLNWFQELSQRVPTQ